MGNINAEFTGQTDRVIIQPVTDGEKGRSSGGTSTTTTSTTSTTGGGSGSGGSERNTGTGKAETIKTGELSEISLLTDEEKAQYATADEAEKKRLIRNAKKRQRYAEKKQANGQDVKPRKVKGAKKEEQPALDVTQLNMIVASLSAVVASRPNCEHWLLNEKEINSITVPLSKMLAESQAFANMGQYSNQIALCMACITVFMPRLIVTVQKQKEVKKIARTGQRTDTNVTDERVRPTGEKKDSNTGTNRGNVKQSSSNGKDNADSIPFYGVPIC